MTSRLPRSSPRPARKTCDAARPLRLDLAAPDPFPTIIDMPEFHRRIRLNNSRFVLEGSRDGTDLRLSPVRRFLTVEGNGTEVLDVVDGKSLFRLKGLATAWWNADSFVISDYTPLDEIAIAQPLRGKVLISEKETGSSCCLNCGRRHVSADLENTVSRIQGSGLCEQQQPRSSGP